MSDTRTPPDTALGWAEYVPGKEAPWDLRRVVHLHRRAGFAAAWKEIQRDLKDGPRASITRVLSGKARAEGVPDNFTEAARLLADSAGDPERLKAWWLYRMLFGPDALTERLTLLWHNHFATSNAKVRDTGMMRRQNEAFRELARAPFGKLLDVAVRQPALLQWLDAPSNRKGQPNENLARELMELFTLGIGHYSETDVKEGARVLTGWTVADGQFKEDPAQHDDGDKVVLTRRGKWKGADLVKMLLDHPATADRLAWRLCEQFMGEKGTDAAGVKALAAGLRKHDLNIGWGVEAVVRSQAFFAEGNLGRHVLSPVELVLGSARTLEALEPAPSTLVLADWCARLGQDLFYPPNVGGWKGGRHWISAQSMIGRANFAAALVGGRLTRQRQPCDVLALARRHGRGNSLREVIAFYGDLLLPGRAPIDRIAAEGAKATLTPETARRAVVLLLASPEAQLG
jgi:uncharacterized protein (DUF1800 family)